ncbi:MAG: trigger factor [Flavobacterium sp.]|nr:trigger factor [Flavobacterium sp.]
MLEVKVNGVSAGINEIEVILTYEEIKPEIEEAYQEEKKTIVIDGFRKGKAPMQMIKKLYGEAIEYKASEKIAQKKFWDVADEKQLKPISAPQMIDLDFVPFEKLSFKIKYEVKPKLELKGYKGLEIEKPVFKIKDEEVETEIKYLYKSQGKFEPADLVENADYKIACDLQRTNVDDPAKAAKSHDIQIDLSDPKVNIEIVNNAIGKKLGDKFSFTFVDEHKHGEETHREEYAYEAEIKKVEKFVNPEETEEFFKKISKDKVTSLEGLKAELVNNMETYYKNQSEQIYMNTLLNKVVENNDFPAPPGFTATVLKQFVEMEKENAKRYNVNAFDEKAAENQLRGRAEWNAKWRIILENIAEAENIKVEENELEELAAKEAEKTGISVAKLVKYYKDSNREELLLEDKVVKFLTENNITKEIDAEEKLNSAKEEGEKKESKSKKKKN